MDGIYGGVHAGEFFSDNGAACPQCGCHIWRYHARQITRLRDTVTVHSYFVIPWCFACATTGATFPLPDAPQRASEVSAAHRATQKES